MTPGSGRNRLNHTTSCHVPQSCDTVSMTTERDSVRPDREGNSEELISRVSHGDVGAMDSLLERHLPGLRAFMRLHAGEHIRAKESLSDLVQSVCREVLQDMGAFDYRGEAAFRQWLFNMAMRKIIDRGRYYKAQKRDVGREVSIQRGATASGAELVPIEFATLFTPSDGAIVRERVEHIERAFRRLPAHYREVITMSRIYGYSNREIARRLGAGEDAIRMRVVRALAKLSGLLAQVEGHP